MAADVREANEDSLLTLADHLPGEAAEALLELATGGTKSQNAVADRRRLLRTCSDQASINSERLTFRSVCPSGCAASFPCDEQCRGTGGRRWIILGTNGRSFSIRRSGSWLSATLTDRRGLRVRRAREKQLSRCTGLSIWRGITGNRAYCSQPFRIRFRTLCELSSVVCFITNRVSAKTSKCIRSMRSDGDSTSCNSVRQTSRQTTYPRCARGGSQRNRRA